MTARQQMLTGRYGRSYKWLALLAVIIGMLTTIFSSTMVNVALTNIMAEYNITQGSAQWMATGFLSAMTVCMLSTAWLMEAWGARATFLLAISLFFVGSLLGQFAPNYDMLIGARIMQGSGAGMLQPLSMALIFQLFPENIRGRAMGIFGMGVVLGPALGPVVGGIITDLLEWRFVFTAGLPTSLIAGILGFMFLPDRPDRAAPGPFNFGSFVLIAISVAALLTGLSNSQFHGFTGVQSYSYLAIAAVGCAAFFTREINSRAPLLRLNMFKNTGFAASAFIAAVVSAGMFSSIYMIPLFVRSVQHLPATDAGLVLLPAGLALAATFPFVGRLIDLTPPWRLILVGILLFMLSSYGLSHANQNSSYWMLTGWTIIGRIALGFILPSNSTLALSIVSAPQVPQASGAINFTRMLGGALGVMGVAILLTAREQYHLLKFSDAGPLTEELRNLALSAAFDDGYLVICGLFIIALLPCLYLGRLSIKKAP